MADLVDWALAGRIGRLVAASGETPAGGTGTALRGDLVAVADDARARVVAYTGLEPVRPVPPPEAIDRPAWLGANLASMRTMLAPVVERLEQRSSMPAPLRTLAGGLLAAEIGALVGYLAQRVLGQYELVLLDPTTGGASGQDDGEAGGARSPERLLLVAPNLREAAERLEVDEAELVAWVTVHEVTHAVQFTGVPWLREYLGGLLRELLGTLDPTGLRPVPEVRATDLLRLPSGGDLRALVERMREGGLVTLAAGPERMALLDRLQATMAVVEGHAEHVMDAVGADLLESLPELRAALERRRREKPTAQRLLERLIGLEMKMKQYEQGKAFCDEVVRLTGVDGLHAVWRSPAELPTADELAVPAAWVARVHPAAAA